MYDDFETNTSYKYLKTVVEALKEPICILGGWAVYFQVNQRFKEANGRDYIGSRDIDLGFHFDENTALAISPMADSIKAIEKLGFEPLSFRYVKDIDRFTGEPTEKMIPLHQRFQMAVDLIVDFVSPKFKHVFRFTPVCEPLLKFAFDGNATRMVEFDKKLLLPSPEVLIATKLHSIPHRSKKDKVVKDLCDLYALLWYTGSSLNTTVNNLRKVTKKTLHCSDEDIAGAAQALGITIPEIQNVVIFVQ